MNRLYFRHRGSCRHIAVEFFYALIPVSRIDFQRFEQGIFRFCRNLDAKRARRNQVVFIQPLNRFGWDLSGDGIVIRRRQGIDIRKRPLPSAAKVLLFRGKAMFQDHVQALALLPCAVAGRTEVDELGASVFGDDDVIRRDVTVDDAFCMHLAEGFHQRQKKPVGFLYAQPSAFSGKILVQGITVHILHDKVRGVIFFKIAVDPDDMLVPVESRKGPRFLQELLLSVFVVLLSLSGVDQDRGTSALPSGKVRGEIFLDGNTLSALIVLGNVGDTEAALAENTADRIPAVQNRAQFQRQRIFRSLSAFVITAEGADSACRLFLEAAIACIGQSLPSFLSGSSDLISSEAL